jgi:hypothetical protein
MPQKIPGMARSWVFELLINFEKSGFLSIWGFALKTQYFHVYHSQLFTFLVSKS